MVQFIRHPYSDSLMAFKLSEPISLKRSMPYFNNKLDTIFTGKSFLYNISDYSLIIQLTNVQLINDVLILA